VSEPGKTLRELALEERLRAAHWLIKCLRSSYVAAYWTGRPEVDQGLLDLAFVVAGRDDDGGF
jgi:hypothetical protein